MEGIFRQIEKKDGQSQDRLIPCKVDPGQSIDQVAELKFIDDTSVNAAGSMRF